MVSTTTYRTRQDKDFSTSTRTRTRTILRNDTAETNLRFAMAPSEWKVKQNAEKSGLVPNICLTRLLIQSFGRI